MGDIIVGAPHPDASIVLLRAFHDHRRAGNDIDRSYRYARDTHPLEFRIVMERALRHGHQFRVPTDMSHWRYEIMFKGHHRTSQNGVSIGRTGCATCVVAKYRNHNFGDGAGRIRIGGSGGRIKEANRRGQRLLSDQEMTVYNTALHRSIFSGLPVRLYAHVPLPDEQYYYVGLVRVTRVIQLWTPEDFHCYEYRVVRFPWNGVDVGELGGHEEQVPVFEGHDEVLALEWHADDEPDADVEPELDDSLEDQQHEKVTEQPSMLLGGELSAYHLEGLEWMLNLFNKNLSGILANEMGLDKTIQTISLIAYLMENKNVAGPHLIVVSKAVLSYWMIGFSTWVPSIIVVHYDGRVEERKVLRDAYSGKEKFNVLITDFDMVMRDRAYLKKVQWQYMFVDEGHRLITYESFARAVNSGFKIRRKILLSGNPVPNSSQELWPLLNFVLPNIFNSAENFELWFNDPFAEGCDVSRTDQEKLRVICRLQHVLRPFMLSRKKMDNERPKENNRPRLMEENEVPEWAYPQPDLNNTGDYKSANVSGKRCWEPVTWNIHKRKRSSCIYMPPHAVLGSANVV
ncbi:probable ATP-dependent DNA helicase CHR719 isoform X2 [Daucus carota subsp. sativus]|uniref:probable ATP-dependent DNA helicase CHR719 isoform X2 n=1 Tax=Daucus carota subsp. sativus TaxID=79200 RepID=UPI0007EFB8A4|nr:PREDICTED: chromatin structure-remodeling complex protein SYD-like isoform X2 [Daucus carota subsp. sativus]